MGNIFWEKKGRLKIEIPNQSQSNVLIKLNSNKFLTMGWQEFKQTFQIDENYGTCFEWDSVQMDSYYLPWIQFVENLSELIEKKQVSINHLPMLNLDLAETGQQKIIIYSLLLYITNAYLFQDYPNVPQQLPKNIAVPLYLISQDLGIKPAFGNAQNMCNWKLIDNEKSHLDVWNLAQRYTFTKKKDEQIFFLLSNLADFRIANILHSAFNVNKILAQYFHSNMNFDSNDSSEQKQSNLKRLTLSEEEEEIKSLTPYLRILLANEQKIINQVIDFLVELKEQIDQITQSLKVMFQKNNPGFFFNHLRHFLQGYARPDVFPNGLYFEGIEKYLIFEGGSGGNSPSFQIFERMIGVCFDGDLEKVQQSMRLGMIQKHINLQNFLKDYSLIRFYSLISKSRKVKEAYNGVIQSYVQFNEKHNDYITYYIEREIKKLDQDVNLNEVKGTGDILLKKVKDRYSQVAQYFITIE